MDTIPVNMTPLEVKAIRTVNAKINGHIGGQTKSRKRLLASRRNAKIARAAKRAA